MNLKTSFFASLGLSLAATALCYYNNDTISTESYTIKKGLKKPFKILQLADLHDKQFGRDNKRLLACAEKIAPDIIVLTGDTVGSGTTRLAATALFVKNLNTIAPVFGILGNHEQRHKHASAIEASLEASGATMLNNELWEGTINGERINILGLCEVQAIHHIDYLKAALGILKYEDHRNDLQALSACNGVRVVLSHFPENFSGIGSLSYCRHPFEVMLSGHTHGGQVRIPGIGGLYAPGQGLFPLFDSGHFATSKNNLIVSRGLGNDVPFPRINNRPQAVVVNII